MRWENTRANAFARMSNSSAVVLENTRPVSATLDKQFFQLVFMYYGSLSRFKCTLRIHHVGILYWAHIAGKSVERLSRNIMSRGTFKSSENYGLFL